MAADSGQPAVGMARSVGRAAALTPVTRIENTDNFRKAAKPRGSCEAQVPFSTAVLSAQQLNSKRQNLRRSKLRAEGKAAATSTGAEPQVRGASCKGGEKKLLDTVAAFWERKKAKTAAGPAA